MNRARKQFRVQVDKNTPNLSTDSQKRPILKAFDHRNTLTRRVCCSLQYCHVFCLPIELKPGYYSMEENVFISDLVTGVPHLLFARHNTPWYGSDPIIVRGN